VDDEGSPMEEFSSIPDYGLNWLEASGDHADIVLSTRVRLARNLQGHAGGPRARESDREAGRRQSRGCAQRCESLRDGTLLELDGTEPRTRRILLERRLVTRDLLGDADENPARGAAVHLSGANPTSVMVNEEDHLRVQSLVSGRRIEEAWRLGDRLDGELGRALPCALQPPARFAASRH